MAKINKVQEWVATQEKSAVNLKTVYEQKARGTVATNNPFINLANPCVIKTKKGYLFDTISFVVTSPSDNATQDATQGVTQLDQLFSGLTQLFASLKGAVDSYRSELSRDTHQKSDPAKHKRSKRADKYSTVLLHALEMKLDGIPNATGDIVSYIQTARRLVVVKKALTDVIKHVPARGWNNDPSFLHAMAKGFYKVLEPIDAVGIEQEKVRELAVIASAKVAKQAKEIKTLNDEKATLTAEKKELDTRNAALVEDNQRKTQLIAGHRQERRKLVEAHEKQLDEAKESLAQTQTRLSKVESELADAKDQAKRDQEVSELTNTVAKLGREKAQLQSNLDTVTSENKQLEQAKKVQESLATKFSKENQQLQVESKTLQEEHDAHVKMQTEIEAQVAKLSGLRESEQKTTIAQVVQQNVALHGEVNKLRGKINSLRYSFLYFVLLISKLLRGELYEAAKQQCEEHIQLLDEAVDKSKAEVDVAVTNALKAQEEKTHIENEVRKKAQDNAESDFTTLAQEVAAEKGAKSFSRNGSKSSLSPEPHTPGSARASLLSGLFGRSNKGDSNPPSRTHSRQNSLAGSLSPLPSHDVVAPPLTQQPSQSKLFDKTGSGSKPMKRKPSPVAEITDAAPTPLTDGASSAAISTSFKRSPNGNTP